MTALGKGLAVAVVVIVGFALIVLITARAQALFFAGLAIMGFALVVLMTARAWIALFGGNFESIKRFCLVVCELGILVTVLGVGGCTMRVVWPLL